MLEGCREAWVEWCWWGMKTYGKTSQSDTSTGTRGLVHLTEDQGDLGLALKLNDGGLLHFVVQIVTLTGTLTDTGEDGETTVGLGDVVLSSCQRLLMFPDSEKTHNQLLNEHSLADTGTSEETDLATTGVRGQKIDDLDTGDEDLGGGGLVSELRGIGVDGSTLVGLDGATLVDGVTLVKWLVMSFSLKFILATPNTLSGPPERREQRKKFITVTFMMPWQTLAMLDTM